MSLSYNQIAGRNLERLAAMSDGIFAVAMTLLVLDLRAPAVEAVHTEAELWRALMALAPPLIMYAMSFLTLGIFWVGQLTNLSHIADSDRNLAWIHIAFLFGVTMMPFSTRLLAEFITYRIALLCYVGNILVLGMVLFASWRYALGAGLAKNDLPAGAAAALERRMMIALALYALAGSLCVVNTYVSIALLVLVQLYYAVAPRIVLPWR